MGNQKFFAGFLFVLFVGIAANYREANCVYKAGMEWQDYCTVVYVTLKDSSTNRTSETAMLTVNPVNQHVLTNLRIGVLLFLCAIQNRQHVINAISVNSNSLSVL